MTSIRHLTRKELEEIIEDIQLILYGEYHSDGKQRTRLTLDRNKVWDQETIELVAQVLEKYDLVPAETET